MSPLIRAYCVPWLQAWKTSWPCWWWASSLIWPLIFVMSLRMRCVSTTSMFFLTNRELSRNLCVQLHSVCVCMQYSHHGLYMYMHIYNTCNKHLHVHSFTVPIEQSVPSYYSQRKGPKGPLSPLTVRRGRVPKVPSPPSPCVEEGSQRSPLPPHRA